MKLFSGKIFILSGLLVLACSPRLAKEEPTAAGDSPLRQAYLRPPAEWPSPTLDSGAVFAELGPLPEVAYPADNPYHKGKAELGRQLFFDPRLSVSNQIACASCHDPELGWGDGRRRSYGHDRQLGHRNAPSILNAGHWDKLFWDGRAATLEEQVFFPIQDHLEMNQRLDEMEAELNQVPEYRRQFREVFGAEVITRDLVARALATFERTVVSRQSRFDRFLEGDGIALTDEELLGLHLFRTKARCINCHNGPLFSDQQFHNNGQSGFGRPGEDLGLFEQTRRPEDMGRFRTPSLRDIFFTGPYMHHGNIAELDEVLFMYKQGMPQIIPKKMLEGTEPLPVKSPLLKPLNLTEKELEALKAFLGAISTRPRPVKVPELP